jgi:hypothetical protein
MQAMARAAARFAVLLALAEGMFGCADAVGPGTNQVTRDAQSTSSHSNGLGGGMGGGGMGGGGMGGGRMGGSHR